MKAVTNAVTSPHLLVVTNLFCSVATCDSCSSLSIALLQSDLFHCQADVNVKLSVSDCSSRVYRKVSGCRNVHVYMWTCFGATAGKNTDSLHGWPQVNLVPDISSGWCLTDTKRVSKKENT